MFYLCKLVCYGDEEGWGPSFPQDCRSWRAVMQPSDPVQHGYSIYQNSALLDAYSFKDPLPDGIERLNPVLYGLLDAAANQYEPAAFLAQRDLYNEQRHDYPDTLPVEHFLAMAEKWLLHHLHQQRSAPYFLARARWNIGYLVESQWYWILGYNSRYDTVSFIHDFHEVECSPANDFEVSREVLLDQFGESDPDEYYPWPVYKPKPRQPS